MLRRRAATGPAPHAARDPPDQADALDGIGESHLRSGNINDGTACLHQALVIYRQLGAPATQRIEVRLAELGA